MEVSDKDCFNPRAAVFSYFLDYVKRNYDQVFLDKCEALGRMSLGIIFLNSVNLLQCSEEVCKMITSGLVCGDGLINDSVDFYYEKLERFFPSHLEEREGLGYLRYEKENLLSAFKRLFLRDRLFRDAVIVIYAAGFKDRNFVRQYCNRSGFDDRKIVKVGYVMREFLKGIMTANYGLNALVRVTSKVITVVFQLFRRHEIQAIIKVGSEGRDLDLGDKIYSKTLLLIDVGVKKFKPSGFVKIFDSFEYAPMNEFDERNPDPYSTSVYFPEYRPEREFDCWNNSGAHWKETFSLDTVGNRINRTRYYYSGVRSYMSPDMAAFDMSDIVSDILRGEHQ